MNNDLQSKDQSVRPARSGLSMSLFRLLTVIIIVAIALLSCVLAYLIYFSFNKSSISNSPDSQEMVNASKVTAEGASIITPGEIFEKISSSIKVHSDSDHLYIESNGMPDHQLMVGITSWQQQVPTPQGYSGANAWAIPLSPKVASSPVSTKTGLFNGAIALAVDGVPIFNALNNRGEDALLVGELDNFGGHSGRADDYHYHTAPLYLEKIVGPGQPIAYGLDGYAIYASTEPDGSSVTENMDVCNGHNYKESAYHYHASKTYPYTIGCLKGSVTVVDDHISPQPVTKPFREAQQPLRGASVTDFKSLGQYSYSLQYQLGGSNYNVNYKLENGFYIFDFIDSKGNVTTKQYKAS